MSIAVLLAICCAVAAALLATEIAFRAWHRRRHGRDYFVALRFPWDEGHVVPHPFLTFAYRKQGRIALNQRLPYALWPNRYWSFREPLRLNGIGHFGPDLPMERRPRTLRIACLGSSGTANNIADEERDYNYPDTLRDALDADPAVRRRFDGVEVMNCGIGGWTTLDVLIDFALNVVHFKPDYVIFYQGLNDLPLHLMERYELDYAHGRRNLGEVLASIRLGYLFPKLPWWHSYEFARDRLVGTGNVRNEVLARIEKARPDYTRPYRPLVAEEMALRNLLLLCRGHGIRAIVGSYVFFLHNDSLRNRKLREGVELENALYERLAREFGLPFVPLDDIVPKDRRYFVDAVHFTPEGIGMVAAELARAVVQDLERTAAPAEMA